MRLIAVLALLFGAVFSSSSHDYNVCDRHYPEYPKAASDLTLEKAVVVIRHGDRMYIKPETCWVDNENEWDCSGFRRVFTDSPGDEVVTRTMRKEFMPLRNYQKGSCILAELTPKGHEQHMKNGKTYRDIYVNQYGLAPSEFNGDDVYVRSTNKFRTMSSADAFMKGMYPTSESSEYSEIPVHTMDIEIDGLDPTPTVCPIIKEIQDSAENATEMIDFLHNHQEFLDKMRHLFGTGDQWTYQRAFDCLTTHICHDMKLPNGVTLDDVNKMKFIKLWALNFRMTHPSAHIGLTANAGQIMEELGYLLSNKHTPKFSLVSGHDSTLFPAIAAIAKPAEDWTPYATALIFEVFSDDNGMQFVRALFNEKVITMKCGDLCTVSEFSSMIKAFYQPEGFCNGHL